MEGGEWGKGEGHGWVTWSVYNLFRRVLEVDSY
jgi:hypothetical protein